jgi:hypothetical protein
MLVKSYHRDVTHVVVLELTKTDLAELSRHQRSLPSSTLDTAFYRLATAILNVVDHPSEAPSDN